MKRPCLYAFKLPNGHFIGRIGMTGPLTEVGPGQASPYTAHEIRQQEATIRLTWPEASPAPCPRWNPESGEYETPIHQPWPPTHSPA